MRVQGRWGGGGGERFPERGRGVGVKNAEKSLGHGNLQILLLCYYYVKSLLFADFSDKRRV